MKRIKEQIKKHFIGATENKVDHIYMYYLKEVKKLSYKDIAKLLDVSVSYVGLRLTQLRQSSMINNVDEFIKKYNK